MSACLETMVAALLGVSLLGACSDKSSPNSDPIGAKPDAAAEDGAAPKPDPDAGKAEPDAGVNPLTRECTLASEHFEAELSERGHQAFGFDVDANNGRLLYGAAGCGDADSPSGVTLASVMLPSNGKASEPATLSTGECHEHRDIAVIASPTGVWGYSVESGPAGDRLLATDLSDEAPKKSTALLDQAGRFSTAIGAGVVGNHAVVAWAHGTSREGKTEVSLFFDGVSESRRVFLPESAGQHVSAIAISRLGSDSKAAVPSVIAWVDSTPDTGAIWTQLIDDRGVAVGEPYKLSDNAGAESRVAVVDQKTGGALTFSDGKSDGQRIRFLSFDGKGKRATSPVSITNLDQNARDVSLSRYGAGYAVVYRIIPADVTQETRIRAAFTDELGNIAGTRDLAPASRTPGVVRAVTARDGRQFVAWIDRDEDAVERLRIVRAVCE